MGLQSHRNHSMDPHRFPEINRDPPLGGGGCTWYTMPSRIHRSTTHLAGVPELVRGHGSIHSIIWTLTNDLQASLTHIENQGGIGVPPHPMGEPQVYYLENKGSPPCQSHFEELFIILALLEIIRRFGGPHDIHILLFDLLRGLLFHLWASLVGLSPKVRLFAHYFMFRGLCRIIT